MIIKLRETVIIYRNLQNGNRGQVSEFWYIWVSNSRQTVDNGVIKGVNVVRLALSLWRDLWFYEQVASSVRL